MDTKEEKKTLQSDSDESNLQGTLSFFFFFFLNVNDFK